MPLPTPNLDDRRFQDLVDECKRMIPRYCPEWTDHNVSDPGITLIELFAWLVEMLLFRLNRVPEKSLITFMELMGVRLDPPTAARTQLTFWLSAPTVEPLTIPAGTTVSTVQTASEPTIMFRTDTNLTVYPPQLIACMTSIDGDHFEDQTWQLSQPDEAFLAFGALPGSNEPLTSGSAFYLGYQQDISSNILSLLIDCRIEGIGVDPTNPPLTWEVWRQDGWVEVELERDETLGLNQRGLVNLYLPRRMARRDLNGRQAYWVRCRYSPTFLEDDPDYISSPQIRSIQSSTVGGTVTATNATAIDGEILGRSNGQPGQVFQLEQAPVLPRRPGETVEVLNEQNEWEPWIEREHFGASGPDDLHFVLDSVSGEVSFGPRIREPNGQERQHGAIPKIGSLIRFSHYNHGGGAAGNVVENTIRVLNSAVPYVDRVTNRKPAVGGRDAESIEHAKLRAVTTLTRLRAVTAEDYEQLATEASSDVARAHCLQAGAPVEGNEINRLPPGVVRVSLVPTVSYPYNRLTPEQLELSQELIQQVQNYLDERRMLTAVVQITQPEYKWVSAEVRLRARPEANPETVRAAVMVRLYRYLNPVVGGVDQTGWPFGRDLYVSEIFTVLQDTPGIAYIESVRLFLENNPEPETNIVVPANGLIASAEHRVIVV